MVTQSNMPVEPGRYAKKQIMANDVVVRWSHGTRFRLVLELVRKHAGGKLLDYGCGDGTFLAMCYQEQLFAGMLGADVEQQQMDDCIKRFAAIPAIDFCMCRELASGKYDGSFDAITCMETLEHAVNLEEIMQHFRRLLSPKGVIIISVPIETGLTLSGKQIWRRVAGWRNIGDYKYFERYPVGDFLRMTFATANTNLPRPKHGPAGLEAYSHYAFNWRALRKLIAQHFVVERTQFSPLGFLGGFISSQAWFICRHKS